MADYPFTPTAGEVILSFRQTAVRGFSPFIGSVAIPVDPGDVTGPVVTLVSPSEGAIGESDNINVTVTDETGLARVILGVRLSIGTVDEKFEFIHDGDGFAVGYTYLPNARTAISGGYDYVLQRQDGWPAGQMQFKVYPFDTSGNED